VSGIGPTDREDTHAEGEDREARGRPHFLIRTLSRVAAEMALHVLPYNLTRVMNLMGVQPLLAAIRT
jgi:transposase